jgi:hypothetical protein
MKIWTQRAIVEEWIIYVSIDLVLFIIPQMYRNTEICGLFVGDSKVDSRFNNIKVHKLFALHTYLIYISMPT